MFNNLIPISMETKSVFGVSVHDNETDSTITLFTSDLIDEACAFALSLYRSINVLHFVISVYRTSDGTELVCFSRKQLVKVYG